MKLKLICLTNKVRMEEVEKEEKIIEVIQESYDSIPSVEELPVVTEEIGFMDKITQVESLKKMAYYAVFGSKDHVSDEVGDAIQSVHIARFESKAQLKKVINSLESKNFKLIDIIKGKPLPYEIQVKKVSEIKIGG